MQLNRKCLPRCRSGVFRLLQCSALHAGWRRLCSACPQRRMLPWGALRAASWMRSPRSWAPRPRRRCSSVDLQPLQSLVSGHHAPAWL